MTRGRGALDAGPGHQHRVTAAGLPEGEFGFRLAFEDAAIGIALVSPQGRWLRVNRALCEITGYAELELVERSFQDITHPDDLEADWEFVRRMLAGEIRTYEMEKRYLRADGSTVWIQLSVSLARDPEGHPDYFISQVQNIDQRKRAEARFRGLLESAPDATVIADEVGRVVSANAQAERLFGYACAELLELTVEELIPPRFRSPHASHRQRFVTDPRARPMGDGLELYALHKDGREIPVEISLSPLETDDGTLVSAAIRDVTGRKRAELALQEAEERFRRAFEEAPIGMAMLDTGGRFVRVNAALREITGYTYEQLVATSSQAITYPEDLGADELQMRSMLAGEIESYTTEKRYVRATGEPVWVAFHAALLRDDAGAPGSFLVQIQDISDRRRYDEQMRFLADHDPLTGLFNRRSFERELDAHSALSARYGDGCAAIVIDLDHFKYINDTLGHTAGDEALARAARVLSSRLRDTDVLARLGGDEFAVLLPKADADTAKQVAKVLLDSLRDEALPLAGRLRPLSASAGIALFGPGRELSGAEALRNADLAMYEAKNAGRDHALLYAGPPKKSSRTTMRESWADRIGRALDENAFVLLAQPIIDLLTGHASQYELLLRLRDAGGGLTPPGAFLPVAERLGLVEEIDRWVTKRAIGLLAERSAMGENVMLEVNLSGLSIGSPELLTLIRHELQRTGAPAHNLIFEITETAAVTNMARASQFAEDLGALGCRFALDDFGAGYSSFYYLKHLPFDFLKIDGEFIVGCRTSNTDRLLIKALVDIAAGMGKQTIAEFVGDEPTVRLLTNLGVDYAQGYHLGLPGLLGDKTGRR